MAAAKTTDDAPTFSKKQVLQSERYMRYRDFFSFKLEEGTQYTIAALDAMIDETYNNTKKGE